jgi:hypothetical protein
LKTLGRLVDAKGVAINILPDAGMDIYSDPVIGNGALISNGRNVYFVNLATVNTNLALAQTQNVVARQLAGNPKPLVLQGPIPGAFLDIAATPTPVLATASDLTIARESSPSNFVNGQQGFFELKLTNQGPDAANNVTFSADRFPFKDPVAVTTTQGACTLNTPIFPADTARFGRTFTCNIGTLASGASVTISATVSRLADFFAGSPTSVEALFVASGAPVIAIDPPTDPDPTNNALEVSAFLTR